MNPPPAPPPITVISRDAEDESDLEIKPLRFFRLFRRLLGYTNAHAGIRRWLIFLVVLRSIQLPLLSWIIAAVINGPIKSHDARGVVIGAAIFLAFAAFTQICFLFRVRLALELGECVVRDMRNELFTHLQGLTAGFYTRMKVGRIIGRMSSDIDAVRIGVQDIVFISMVQGGQLLVSAALMFYYDKVLFSVVAVIAPILWALNRQFQGRLSNAQRQAQESFSRVTATLAESVGGIRVTQGFVRQEVNAGLFRDLVQDHSRYSMGAARTNAVFLPLLELNSQFFIAILLVLGGYRVLNPHIAMPVGNIVQFFVLAGLFFDPIRSIGNQYAQALNSVVGAERVFRLLDTRPEWVDPPDAVPISNVEGRVEFRDLSFGYVPGRLILKDINFIAEPGRTIALVGHTGSGKTSIINLVSKAYLPTSGLLLVDGRDIRTIESVSLHRRLGIVHQQSFLFDGTIMENIRFSRPEATDAEVREAARALDFLDMLESLPDGFQTAVGESGGNLSVGQRQLISFTRAWLADPRILILDEATSSIDGATEARIQNALQTLLRGRTSFVVAHRLSTIRQADLILVMDRGVIAERGTHSVLLDQGGLYHKLYTRFVMSGAAGIEPGAAPAPDPAS